MLKHRIIPVLLWDGDQVVQSVRFNRPHRKCGAMRDFIRVMEKRNVDELILIDINATLENREPKFDLIKEYCSELFCPVTYGGGISKIEHVDKLIQECGVDKIAIKKWHYLMDAVANKYGKQAVVASVDHAYGNAQYDDYSSMLSIENWCWHLQSIGAGEILLTDIECNGMKNGYATGLIHAVSKRITVPIVANGGCWGPEHMKEAFNAGADACAASSMFLFTEHTPKSCARYLHAEGIPTRLDDRHEFIPENQIDRLECLSGYCLTKELKDKILSYMKEAIKKDPNLKFSDPLMIIGEIADQHIMLAGAHNIPTWKLLRKLREAGLPV